MAYRDPSEMTRAELQQKLIEESSENSFLLEKTAEHINDTFNLLGSKIHVLKTIVLKDQNQKMIQNYNKVTEGLIEKMCELIISEEDINKVKKMLDD